MISGLGTKLRIQLSKTVTGGNDYVQILSEDGWSVNIVLIAPEIEIEDKRIPEAEQDRDADEKND